MLTLSNNSATAFRITGATHKTAAWRSSPFNHRADQVRLMQTPPSFRRGYGESQPLPTDPPTPELPDDFPFSALLRVVREMHE